jgi:ER-bound oxygenase mpaB/B'/Rubber oxygenase, catalytic domain
MGRYDNLRHIERLDPERDHQEIVRITGMYEFPWDTTRALEFALYKTFCVPSISALLDQTGEFRQRAQKRYDDTALLIAELTEWGYDSDRGHAALRQMNRIHRRFVIANDDYLYVLTTFILEPIRWIDRFGWRRLSGHERLAQVHFWREVGRRMGIRDIPETYAELEQYNMTYERERFRYGMTNQRVGEATRDLFLSWFPAPLRPLLTPGIYAMLEEPVLDAFGFPHPPRWLRRLTAGSLRLRGRILRRFPPRRRPRIYTAGRHRTYPHGYEIADLGPPDFVASGAATQRSGLNDGDPIAIILTLPA